MKKVLQGEVLVSKMQKTIVVRVTRTFRHPFYQKVIARSKKYQVHDEKTMAHPGDLVEIVETRPLSRKKRWRIVKVLRKGEDRDLSSESLASSG